MRRASPQQIRPVNQSPRDEVGDRHLGVLGLPLHPALNDEQPRPNQRGAVARPRQVAVAAGDQAADLRWWRQLRVTARSV
jgi:hypothetical protein